MADSRFDLALALYSNASMPDSLTSSSPSPLRRLRYLLGMREGEPAGRELRPWFAVAILYAAGCALLALRQAFASPYMVADDAREHVFWMFRYLDPRLFRQNPIADYFQSLAPGGYATLYWFLARLGIDPLLASKCIPSVLSLFATGYFFLLAWRFFRSPAAATLSACLFSQCLWLNSDLSSATPRAFFYPLFVAFLYYHVRASRPGVLISVGLQALFFPPAALLSLGVLGWDCLSWDHGLRIAPVKGSRNYLVIGVALGFALLCVLPYLHRMGAFGPLVTYAEARRMPEFGPKGRVPFFFPTWWGNWVAGNGGIHTLPTRPPWFLAAFLWPLLRRFPRQFPLLNAVPRGSRPVPQIIGAALSLFAVAHLFLFHLYLPNRYTESSTRVLLMLLAGGVLLALIDGALRWAETRSSRRLSSSRLAALGFSGLLLAVMLAYPLVLSTFPSASYVKGTAPGLYRFFALQPATIHIASLSDQADNLPVFCRRSVIIGAECAVPFHPAYYLPLRARGLQIARAQDSADLAVLQQCLREQHIDFWLLDRGAFSPGYVQKSRLLRQLNLSRPDQPIRLAQGATPFLERPPPESVVYQNAHFLVLDAHRLLALPAH
ncbi:MAG: hypothetical protein ACREIF_17050 [Chthoniobacterales bacterium]